MSWGSEEETIQIIRTNLEQKKDKKKIFCFPAARNMDCPIAFVDGTQNWSSFFIKELQQVFPGARQVHQQELPKLVFFSVWGKQHHAYPRTIPRIFVCAEPSHGNILRHEYDILIDCKASVSGIYLPYCVLCFAEMDKYSLDDLKDLKITCPSSTRKQFGAFLYFHDVSFRNTLFDEMNHYLKKEISETFTAIGKCRNNSGIFDRARLIYLDTAVE